MDRKMSCEYCIHYDYNEEYECYECEINLDEDEMIGFLSNSYKNCPHFKFGDEYLVVRKQM
ncbi:DUF6472 family protein [Lacrimispora sp. BS-2]|uniref:DUF6472 family protein n=1 Tax=Lacrimispora sp. BS-2 TaxID=3151850 RepID=A0AAU7PQM0_9FIRM